MKNEYGVRLDRRGYAPSILLPDTEWPTCFICHQTGKPLDRHEIFPAASRQLSKEYGLWITVCRTCHEKFQSSQQLKPYAQRIAMEKYGWTESDFIAKFGENYL